MNSKIMKAMGSNGAMWEGEKHQLTGNLLGLFCLQKGKMSSGQKQELSNQAAWVQIPALPLTSCVTSGVLLNLSVHQFPHFKRRDNDRTPDTEVEELTQVINVKCTAHSMWYVSVCYN